MFFKDERIQTFWEEPEVAQIPLPYIECIRVILVELDKKPWTSSIVAGAYGRYRALSSISLIEHSINAAHEIKNIFAVGSKMYLNGFIAALGHDIAKCSDALDSENYTEINHARLSGTMLHFMLREYLSERELEYVVDAATYHHDFNRGKTPLIPAVKTADKNARKKETLALGIELLSKEKRDEDEPKKTFISAGQETPTVKRGADAPRKERSAPPDPSSISMPWFSIDDFLDRLKPLINRQVKTFPDAFSMRDDVCYFGLELVFNVVKEMAMEILWLNIELYELNHIRKRDVQAFVGEALRRKGALADNLLPDLTFYYNQFVLVYQKYPPQEGWYMPIYGSFFTTNIMFLEKKKGAMLRQLKYVKPNRNWGA